MIGRSQLQDTAQPVRDGRSLLGAQTVYELDKGYPSKRYAQTPPPASPPWAGLRGMETGGLAAAPRYAIVNVENMLPVLVVAQRAPTNAGRHNQAGLMSRLRSSYALLPLGSPGSGQ